MKKNNINKTYFRKDESYWAYWDINESKQLHEEGKGKSTLTPMDHPQPEEHHFHNLHKQASILNLVDHPVVPLIQTGRQLQISIHNNC